MERERGAVRSDPGGRLGVALVYPNGYRLGMANLGVHAVYRLFNQSPSVLCERAFAPDRPGEGEVRTLESGRPLREFDVVAFSLSFEEDYLRILEILSASGLPLRARERGTQHPLVVAGGIAVQINPEPIAPFFDALLIGEGERLVEPFVSALRVMAGEGLERAAQLGVLASLSGCYVPELYDVSYGDTERPGGEWVTRFQPRPGAPERVKRLYVEDLRAVATSRVIDSPDALFGDLFLTELARGCLWGCRFCAAGFVQRPYRQVSLEVLRAQADEGIARGQRIGLVGPDLGDHTGFEPLTRYIGERGGSFSPSSLRVEAITPELSRQLAAGGERSVTIAPEAGSERLRRVVNKDFSDDRIVQAVETALSQGMQHVKLYFMCGLPTETDDDLLSMVRLAVRIREEVMKRYAKERGRMGRITLSVNPFVPKPWTPFQWAAMQDQARLKKKKRLLEGQLAPRGFELEFASPRQTYFQALLSRGDRRCADLLELAHLQTGGELKRALRLWPHDPDYFVTREVGISERLPWDFVDQGVEKSFLERELRQGLQEKITPKCRVESCRACGLDCAAHPELKLER